MPLWQLTLVSVLHLSSLALRDLSSSKADPEETSSNRPDSPDYTDPAPRNTSAGMEYRCNRAIRTLQKTRTGARPQERFRVRWENGELKRLVVDLSLDREARKAAIRKNDWSL
jgi:hypothetical protein